MGIHDDTSENVGLELEQSSRRQRAVRRLKHIGNGRHEWRSMVGGVARRLDLRRYERPDWRSVAAGAGRRLERLRHERPDWRSVAESVGQRLNQLRRERPNWRHATGGLLAAIAAASVLAATTGGGAAAESDTAAEPFDLVQVSHEVDEVMSTLDEGRLADAAREAADAEAAEKDEAAAQAEAEAEAAAEEEQPEWISPSDAVITSSYGERWGRLHAGMDFANNTGDPIWTIADGTVTYAGWMDGYGNLVVVKHDDGTETAYGHASELLVSTGDEVSQGDELSLAGSTGNSTGPHLHFEVRIDGVQVDPQPWLEDHGVDLG